MLGRSRDRDRGRGFGADSPSQLQLLLALSPSVLYWRAQSAGTVGIDGSGGTATGTDPVGRLLDLSGNNNHASAPATGNRATLNTTGWVFDGTDDYYNLASAINVTTNMTVVRAFKRATAGIINVGLGQSGSFFPTEGRWGSGNSNAVGLGASEVTSAATSTATGSFVFTAQRTASVQSLRRNGAAVALNSTTPPTVSGSFQTFGRVSTSYNNGEISFLALFPTELTGANLALVEQIAAATNGTTLA